MRIWCCFDLPYSWAFPWWKVWMLLEDVESDLLRKIPLFPFWEPEDNIYSLALDSTTLAGLVLSCLPRSHRSYFEFILPPLQLLVAICCFCTFPSSLLYEGTTWLFSSPAFLAKCDLVSRAKLYLEPSAEEKRETASSTACEVPSLKWRIIWGVCLRSCDLLSFVL